MRSTPWGARFVAFLGAGALLAAACSGSDAQDTTTTTVEAPQAAATTTTTTAATTTTITVPERFDGQLAGLTVIDENTFTVELVEPDPEFPLRLGYAAFFALPDAAFADPDGQNEMPIGNGPFMMDGPWEHNVRIKAVRNPDYRGPDPATIDSLEWALHSSDTTAYNDVLTGDLDLTSTIPPEFFDSAQDHFGDNYGESPNASLNYLGIPAYLPRYTKEHRQALSMAVDRERLTETMWAGTATPAHAAIPPALGGRDYVCDNWGYHPEEAKALWEATGGLDEIVVWFNEGGGHEDWIDAVVGMWSDVLGIDPATVSFETREFSEYLAVAVAGEYTGVFRLGWGQDYPSPLNFLEPLYASYNAHGGTNPTSYTNPSVDAALAAGMAKVAASGLLADGLADYFAAEDLVCEDVPVIPIRFGSNQYVHSDNVGDVHIDSEGHFGYTVMESETGRVAVVHEEPESLFSTNANEYEGIEVLRALNTGLVEFDPRTNAPFNAHARSITSDDGGMTWTVALNPGWTFHDGTPNDAASYVKAWSYGADAANGQGNNWFYRNIVGYDELNPDTED